MQSLEDRLRIDLLQREASGLLRELPDNRALIDFCSNDYLGFARDEHLKKIILQNFHNKQFHIGASGSRLISGNSTFAEKLEKKIAIFHHAESALLFNSGYDANVGFFSCVPKRGDTVLYDDLVHASIRDGIRQGLAKSFSVAHNNIEDLKRKMSLAEGNVFVAVEAVYSMDGDAAPLKELAKINGIHLVVDEAHSAGLCGTNGEGKVVEEGLEERVFARLITYGKAFGVHGAAVIGSDVLIRYLINYARSFIYSTFSSDFNLVAIAAVYDSVEEMRKRRARAFQLKTYFTKRIEEKELKSSFIQSDSLIQSFVVGENHGCKNLEKILKQRGFAVKAIVSPTVPKGAERLRISLHSSNSELEIDELCEIIAENRKS